MHKFQVNSFQSDLQKTSFTSFHILHRKLTTQLRACDMLRKKKKHKQTHTHNRERVWEKGKKRRNRKQSAKSWYVQVFSSIFKFDLTGSYSSLNMTLYRCFAFAWIQSEIYGGKLMVTFCAVYTPYKAILKFPTKGPYI